MKTSQVTRFNRALAFPLFISCQTSSMTRHIVPGELQFKVCFVSFCRIQAKSVMFVWSQHFEKLFQDFQRVSWRDDTVIAAPQPSSLSQCMQSLSYSWQKKSLRLIFINQLFTPDLYMLYLTPTKFFESPPPRCFRIGHFEYQKLDLKLFWALKFF